MNNLKKTISIILLILVVLAFLQATGCVSPPEYRPNKISDEEFNKQQDKRVFTYTIILVSPILLVAGYFGFKITKFLVIDRVIAAMYYSSAAAGAGKARELFSRVTGSEGFEEANPDEYQDLHERVSHTQLADGIIKNLPAFRYFVLFKKERPEYKMYMGYTYCNFVFTMISSTAYFPENMIIKNIKHPDTMGETFGEGINLVARPLAPYIKDIPPIPNAVKEIVSRSTGAYPICSDLNFIFVGKSGLMIAARETTNNQEIYNMLKFSRELAAFLEEEIRNSQLDGRRTGQDDPEAIGENPETPETDKISFE